MKTLALELAAPFNSSHPSSKCTVRKSRSGAPLSHVFKTTGREVVRAGVAATILTCTHCQGFTRTTEYAGATRGGMAIRLGNSKKVYAVKSFAEASAAWEAYRDAHDLGASQSTLATVVDLDSGEKVASVSYNGRVWANDGTEIGVGDYKTAAEQEAEGWRDLACAP